MYHTCTLFFLSSPSPFFSLVSCITTLSFLSFSPLFVVHGDDDEMRKEKKKERESESELQGERESESELQGERESESERELQRESERKREKEKLRIPIVKKKT